MKKLSFKDYVKLDGMNQSSLKMILDSPLTFKHYYIDGNERPDSAAFKFGRAFHTRVEEPEQFGKFYVTDEKIKTSRGKAYDELCAANPGKTVLNYSAYKEVIDMGDALIGRPEVKEILKDATIESVIEWTDPDFGVKCKGMVDVYKDGIVYDLKTASEADPGNFFYAIKKCKYQMQAAFYLDGMKAVTGNDHLDFYIIAAEKKEPYNYAIYKMNNNFLAEGQEMYKKALHLYVSCMKFGQWPSYASGEIGPGETK